MEYPQIIKQELVAGKVVVLIDGGLTGGQRHLFVCVDGVMFGPSVYTHEDASEIFKNAVADSTKL